MGLLGVFAETSLATSYSRVILCICSRSGLVGKRGRETHLPHLSALPVAELPEYSQACGGWLDGKMLSRPCEETAKQTGPKCTRSTPSRRGSATESRSRPVIIYKFRKNSMTRSLPQTRLKLPQKLPQSRRLSLLQQEGSSDKPFAKKGLHQWAVLDLNQ